MNIDLNNVLTANSKEKHIDAIELKFIELISKKIDFDILKKYIEENNIDLNKESFYLNLYEKNNLFDILVNFLKKDNFYKVLNLFPNFKIKEETNSLFHAIKNNHNEAILYLLEQLKNINYTYRYDQESDNQIININTGITPLIKASYHLKDNDIYLKILNKTNDLNNKTEIFYYDGDRGNETALHWASYKCDVEKLEILYQYKNIDFKHKEAYDLKTFCGTLYNSCIEKNKIDIFINFIKNKKDLIENELNSKENEFFPEYLDFINKLNEKLKIEENLNELNPHNNNNNNNKNNKI